MEILDYVPPVYSEWVVLQESEEDHLNKHIANSRKNIPEHIGKAKDLLALKGAPEEIQIRVMSIILAFRTLAGEQILPCLPRYKNLSNGYSVNNIPVLSFMDMYESDALLRTGYQRGMLFVCLPDSTDAQYESSRLLVINETNKYLSEIGRPQIPQLK